MKPFYHGIAFVWPLLLLCSACKAGQIELLPGLFFYNGSEPLTGRFLFVHANGIQQITTNATEATVYAFDLENNVLRAILETPPLRAWDLKVTPDGTCLCLMFGYFTTGQTNVLLWLENGRFQRSLNLPAPPEQQRFAAKRVFFTVPLLNGSTSTTQIIEYDPTLERTRVLMLQEASLWEWQVYRFPSEGTLRSGTELEFSYGRGGNRLKEGTDYKPGLYSFDPETNQTKWKSDHDPSFGTNPILRSRDGRYIFFADLFPSDRNDSIHGRKLVVSALPETEAAELDRRGHKFKTITRFRHDTDLCALSPCRRYVLLKQDTVASKNLGTVTRTYFLVDVATAKSRVLLKDETARKTSSVTDVLRWVGSP